MIANRFFFFQLITYGIASAGLFVALYRIRPVSINCFSLFPLLAIVSVLFYESHLLSSIIFQFAKFKKPSDVPSHFLQSRVPLQGTVMRVEPSHGALLMVNHQPLLPFLNFNNKNYLPVKISGVDITGNGMYQIIYHL